MQHDRVCVGVQSILRRRNQFSSRFRQGRQVNLGSNLIHGRDHLSGQRFFQLLDAGNQRRCRIADDGTHRLAELYWVDH
ncbi:hypothetical protein D3C84_962280 [compost metagenome]